MARKMLDPEGVAPARAAAMVALGNHDADCKRLSPLPAGWQVVLLKASACGAYRYQVGYRWSAGPLVMFLMMNPSGADGASVDATVRKTAGWAQAWGFGGQLIVNACAYRYTKSGKLDDEADPQGPENIAAILEAAEYADFEVVAHGNLGPKTHRHATAAVEALKARGYELFAIKLSNAGIPFHPGARGKNRLPHDLPKPSIRL